MKKIEFVRKIQHRITEDLLSSYDVGRKDPCKLNTEIRQYIAQTIYMYLCHDENAENAVSDLKSEELVALLTEYNIGRAVLNGVYEKATPKIDEIILDCLKKELGKEADMCMDRLNVDCT